MREEHPIDERFKALYDAEAAPPGEVRDALAQQLGWDTGTIAGSTRRRRVVAHALISGMSRVARES